MGVRGRLASCFEQDDTKFTPSTFEDYDNKSDQLQHMLGSYGFDHETDIKAITSTGFLTVMLFLPGTRRPRVGRRQGAS